MFTLQIFAEILIVGLFLLFAISPLAIRWYPKYQKRDGLLPMFNDFTNRTAFAAMALIFAYSVGVVGNQLIDDLFDKVEDSIEALFYKEKKDNRYDYDAQLRIWADKQRQMAGDDLAKKHSEAFVSWQNTTGSLLRQASSARLSQLEGIMKQNQENFHQWEGENLDGFRKIETHKRNII